MARLYCAFSDGCIHCQNFKQQQLPKLERLLSRLGVELIEYNYPADVNQIKQLSNSNSLGFPSFFYQNNSAVPEMMSGYRQAEDIIAWIKSLESTSRSSKMGTKYYIPPSMRYS